MGFQVITTGYAVLALVADGLVSSSSSDSSRRARRRPVESAGGVFATG